MSNGMNLPNDPMILLSYLNTQLRDSGEELAEFCKAHALDMEAIIEKLKAVGFTYDPQQRRFR